MRRLPKQKRSLALVESLLDATLLTIAGEGLNAATTVRIAERAGVSVGSLYQYFDRKEDLYEAVLERFVKDMSTVIDHQATARSQAPLSEFIHEMLNAIWDFLEDNDGCYHKLSGNLGQMNSSRFLAMLENKMLTVISQFLVRNPPPQAIPNIHVKTFVLVNSIMLTMVRYIGDPAPGVNREQMVQEFVHMATWMITSQH